VGFLIRMALTAAGLWLADRLVSGVVIQGDLALLGSALALGLVNALVRPIVVVLTLPITVLSLGLFLWAINAGMIWLAAVLVDGFAVASFGSALVAAAIVSLTGWFGSSFVGPRGRYEVMVVRSRRRRRRQIDE
jgi:putative membrane protein